jgi:opacity protein-like surface antigen
VKAERTEPMSGTSKALRRSKSFTLIVFLLFICSVSLAVPAEAEWFADLYLGGAFTQTGDIDVGLSGVGVSPVTISLKDVAFDNSVEVGGRAGYWFETLSFLGLGLDVFHFRPDVSSQTVRATLLGMPGTVTLDDIDIRLIGITLDLMLRWPFLKSGDFPKGRLQPYTSLGPAIFITKTKPAGLESDTDTSLGLKVGAGAIFLITTNIGIFGEYRFTHVSPEFKFTTAGTVSKPEFDINTHHLIVGASFRF